VTVQSIAAMIAFSPPVLLALAPKTWRDIALLRGQLQRLDQPLSPPLELRVGARQARVELPDAHLVLADHRASYPLGVLIQPALTFFDVLIDLLPS
jgi:hypothetical protein